MGFFVGNGTGHRIARSGGFYALIGKVSLHAKALAKLCYGIILVLQFGSHVPINVKKIFDQLIFGQFKHNGLNSFQTKPSNNREPASPGKTKLLGIVINKIDRKYKQMEYQKYQKVGQ